IAATVVFVGWRLTSFRCGSLNVFSPFSRTLQPGSFSARTVGTAVAARAERTATATRRARAREATIRGGGRAGKSRVELWRNWTASLRADTDLVTGRPRA